MARVMVAMSGGVDSSVAAALLKDQGHDVVGVTMAVWEGGSIPQQWGRHGCYGPEEKDIEDARKVCETLGIPFHVFDLRREYRTEVLDYVRHEYLSGRTPNPCIRCNRRVKLDSLVEKTRERGIEFDYVATGHYARVEWDQIRRRYLLKRARDRAKDQSYFLSALSQGQLGFCLFPLGNHTKEGVRKIASDLALPVDEKPESQDFIAGGYSLLLGAAPQPGPILDRKGNLLGEHRGVPFYTIGQRRGLGVARREALYVTDIAAERNAVFVGTRNEVYGSEFTCSEVNWIAVEALESPVEVRARIRSNHRAARAAFAPMGGGRAHVKFEEPQMAITSGQTVVFYDFDDDDVVLASGTIERKTG